METNEIKEYYQPLFERDNIAFLSLNPKCLDCGKRSYGSQICLICGAYPKRIKLFNLKAYSRLKKSDKVKEVERKYK